MICPFKGGILKVANASAHDIKFDDVYIALELMKENNPEVACRWQNLTVLLTDETDVTSWQGKLELVKEACRVKRVK